MISVLIVLTIGYLVFIYFDYKIVVEEALERALNRFEELLKVLNQLNTNAIAWIPRDSLHFEGGILADDDPDVEGEKIIAQLRFKIGTQEFYVNIGTFYIYNEKLHKNRMELWLDKEDNQKLKPFARFVKARIQSSLQKQLRKRSLV